MALITLLATVIGFVLTSKVGNAVNTSLVTAAYEGTTMVVQSINQFYIKSVLAREDIQHKDIPQKVQFILANVGCSNLPLSGNLIESLNFTMVENRTGFYFMHGSYISFNICATTNHSSPERGEVFILSNLTEARFFDPQRYNHGCFRSFAIGYSQSKQPWMCTLVNCTINDDGYYSVIFLEPGYPVQYRYRLKMAVVYIDFSSLRSSWNCTVYDEGDLCHQEWPWVPKETCLIARIGSNDNLASSSLVLDHQKHFIHIAVDLTLQSSVQILGYIFSGLSLLIFIFTMVFCCLGYKKQLGYIKNTVV